MKIKRMSLDAVKKKQQDIGESLSNTQIKHKEMQTNKRRIDNLHEIISDSGLDEEYRRECAIEVGKVENEYYEQMKDIQYDLINLNNEVKETKEEIEDNIENINGAQDEISGVEDGKDNRSMILKLKSKLKEKTNGSLKEWNYHKEKMEAFEEDIKEMKKDV